MVTLRYPKMAPNLTKREPEKTQIASNLGPNLVQVVAFGAIFAPGGCSQKRGGPPRDADLHTPDTQNGHAIMEVILPQNGAQGIEKRTRNTRNGGHGV